MQGFTLPRLRSAGGNRRRRFGAATPTAANEELAAAAVGADDVRTAAEEDNAVVPIESARKPRPPPQATGRRPVVRPAAGYQLQTSAVGSAIGDHSGSSPGRHARQQLAANEAEDTQAEHRESRAALEAQEALARRRIAALGEPLERETLFGPVWAAMLGSAHSDERRRVVAAEGDARDAVLMEEDFRFGLILDVKRRDFRKHVESDAATRDGAMRAADLDMRSRRFAAARNRREQETILPVSNKLSDAASAGGAPSVVTSFFVVPRSNLRAAALADLLQCEDSERAERREIMLAENEAFVDACVRLAATIERAGSSAA